MLRPSFHFLSYEQSLHEKEARLHFSSLSETYILYTCRMTHLGGNSGGNSSGNKGANY